ncbi:C1 family peptidase [Chitinophaga horti]|uniref:C1 family peptidase n=1 Tax=Chitinophaga horti TaxID=2920382 RepID=A0ABY6J5M4_9BACT|nr:C1 family peptidase [Chitinophaga horti]UYQ94984.1 C1 family peptidase [Chitinophaga horti]
MKFILTLVLSLLVWRAQGQDYGLGDKTTQAELNRLPLSKEISSKEILPTSYTLKRYTLPPDNQGPRSTCAARAVAAARSILYAYARGFTNSDSLRKYKFCPEYLYYKIKKPNDSGCIKGASVTKALDVVKKTGIVLRSQGLGDCPPYVDSNSAKQAGRYKLKADSLLSDKGAALSATTILKIKRALKRNNPVVISMRFYESFRKVGRDGFWAYSPTESLGDTLHHAMCIVGYDDFKKNGSFEVINSWGSGWGNNGYCWLTYEQLLQHVRYAIEVIDYNANAEIITGKIELLLPDNSPLNFRLKQPGNNETDTRLGNAVRYEMLDTFPTGITFKMKLGLTANGYVYLFSRKKDDSFSLVYPSQKTTPATFNSANQSCTLPSKGSFHVNEHNSEELCVIFSKDILDVDRLLDCANTNRMGLQEALQEICGVPPEQINDAFFDMQNMQFKTPKHRRYFLICYSFNINTML